MGISLTGLTPATTYDALIKVGDNGPITAALKVLSDGLGTNLPMEASTTAINFTGALQQSGVAVPTAGQVAAKQDTLVSGTNIKTVNSTSLVGSGNVAVQETLVSGTSIKTLNSVSLLGSGDIVVSANPSGVAGAIQFSNGSAFASDAANLFFDNTNKRLGIGTNAPSDSLSVAGTTFLTQATGSTTLTVKNTGNGVYNSVLDIFERGNGNLYFGGQGLIVKGLDSTFGGTTTTLGARVGIKGSGSTSATTSLLVQNSAGSEAFKVDDDRGIILAGSPASGYVITATGSNAAARFGECAIGTWGVGGIFSLGSTNSTVVRVATNNIAALYLDTNQSVNVGIVAAVSSAKLQVDSTTKGFLPPRMTTTQKNAIASPATGLVVYDNTTNKLQCYNGSTWNDLF